MTARAVIRVDGGPQIGGGHVMRCLSFAQGLRRGGWDIVFAVRPATAEGMPALAAAGHAVLPLDDADDAAAVGRAAGPAALVAVDHYGLDAAFERGCRAWADRVLVFDDLDDRPHDADLVVFPLPGMKGGDRRVAGTQWAPLRETFLAHRGQALARRGGDVERILVAFGATDPVNGTAFALDALRRTAFAGKIDVVLGGSAPHLDAVRRSVAALEGRATLHVEPGDMAALLTRADLAVGAAGSSAWERCCLGLPAIMVGIADNQDGIVRALGETGAARDAGRFGTIDAATLAATVDALCADEAARRAMSVAAARLVDGRGTDRVRCALAGRVGAVGLRPATDDDGDLLLNWQRDPGTRRFARSPGAPEPAAHRAWLARTLGNPDRLLCIVEENGVPAGSLRLDEAACGGLEVSIYTAPDRYRRGIGRAALALARRLAPGRTIHAHVLPGNEASRALFAGAGYRPAGEGHYVELPS